MMEKHQLNKSLYTQSKSPKTCKHCYGMTSDKTDMYLEDALFERSVGASHAARSIIKLLSPDLNDDQLDIIFKAHTAALEAAIKLSDQADELSLQREAL